MLSFYTAGMMAQMRKHAVKKASIRSCNLLTVSEEYGLIGKRITVSYFIGLMWSAVVIGALIALRVRVCFRGLISSETHLRLV